ncbi:MAG: hypothetical protein NTV31_02350 [Bacteroidia bacterium]|nr:hypothetical protein [Bacteroidia bacterium]
MKNYLTILLLIFVSQSGFCQDKLNTKDKKQLNVQIIEQTPKLIKYKMLDYENGPILSIKINQISSIEYKNGIIDRLGNQNPRKNKPLGINTGVVVEVPGRDGMFSATLDYFVIPQIDIEINFGTDLYRDIEYFSAGPRFHLNSDNSENRFTPFAGLLFGSSYEEDFLQIPVGLSFITKAGFSTSLSLNGTINRKTHIYEYIPPQRLTIEFRIGWRFKV